MTTPIDPEMCLRTGRLLTEWFEYPQYTPEDEVRVACEQVGVEPEDVKSPFDPSNTFEEQTIARKVNGLLASRRQRSWRNNMTQQEVAMRMNEATKMVDPSNYKFLPDDVRERTGLEVNPLWMMECLVRAGVLSPKEQVSALKELAQYTHSKAPNISHSTTTTMKPEDWLLELAKEEYQEIEIEQPLQPVERGSGKRYEERKSQRVQEVQSIASFGDQELAEMEKLIGEDFEDISWEDLTDYE